MSSERNYISLNEWPIDQLLVAKVNYYMEAAWAMTFERGDRSFFIREPERMARSEEELKDTYRLHQEFKTSVLDARDRLLEGHEELESYLGLKVVSDSETYLFTNLLTYIDVEASRDQVRRTPITITELIDAIFLSWKSLLYYELYKQEDNDLLLEDLDSFLASRLEAVRSFDLSDFTSVVSLIMNSDNNDEVKIRLIKIHQNSEQLFREYASLLMELAAFIEQAADVLRRDIDRLGELFESEASWFRIKNKLASVVKVRFPENGRFFVGARLILPNSLTFSYNRPGIISLDIGIYYFELTEQVERVKEQIRTIEEGAKLLSDSSRLKIIMLLQTRAMYLREIADALNLSPATVSHHVQHLINHDLLTIDVMQNRRRVYYALRPESFEELGQSIRRLGEKKYETGK